MAFGVGVGDRTMIEDAIIDKNAKIGTDVSLSPRVWKKGGPTMILEFRSRWSLGRGQECGRTVRTRIGPSRFYLEEGWKWICEPNERDTRGLIVHP